LIELGENEYLLITFIILSVGFAQGYITGNRIRKKFQRTKYFLRFVSIIIAGLFIIQATIRIDSISHVQKSVSNFALDNPNQLFEMMNSLIPSDTFGWISLGIPTFLVILTFVSKLSKLPKLIFFGINIIALGFMISVKFLGVNIDADTMMLFVVYQIGIPMGVLVSTGALDQSLKWISKIKIPTF